MRKKFKPLVSLGIIVKLFMISSLATATPADPGSSQSGKATVIRITTEQFKQLVYNYDADKSWKYQGSKPAIIDFYATWCGPCSRLSPLVEEIADEYSGKIVVYKVDTDQEKKLARDLGISGLPTLLFIPLKGEPRASMGLVPKETIIKAINDILLVR